jgi:hypothetical protein
LADALTASVADSLTVVVEASESVYVAVALARSPLVMVPPLATPPEPIVSESVIDEVIVPMPQLLIVGVDVPMKEYVAELW